jgi:D-serine deaminase-like pyridoxal phosphate-dependent protein
MQNENRRARRHLLGEAVEVTDLESEKQIATSARNLSLLGCFVATATPFATGTKVRLRITHQGATFAALGRVAFVSASEGMGIAFGEIEARDQAILNTWLGEDEV